MHNKTVAASASVVTVMAMAILLATTCQAQTEKLIFSFNGSNGRTPNGSLVFDAAGNLYGTTQAGGHGMVFELSPSGGIWTESALHYFAGGDGELPMSGVIFDANGNLYGTTYSGGAYGYGEVYELSPSASGWNIQILYSFMGASDGGNPAYGVTFDNAGNLYGTTNTGGANSQGVAFELSQSAGVWTESVIQDFNTLEGTGPSPLTFWIDYDYLLGTAAHGGYMQNGENGTIYVLDRRADNQVPWQHSVLYPFDGIFLSGATPMGGVVLDSSGNIYGYTQAEAGLTVGWVYKLASQVFTYTKIFSLQEGQGTLTVDSSGNLYGAGASGGGTGQNAGLVFKLNPGVSGQRYIFGDKKPGDGKDPQGGLVLDSAGNVYGATARGGGSGQGAIFEITF